MTCNHDMFDNSGYYTFGRNSRGGLTQYNKNKFDLKIQVLAAIIHSLANAPELKPIEDL